MHPPSLIRSFACAQLVAKDPSFLHAGQRWLWLDWADVQTDLSFRWVHIHFVGFVELRLKFTWYAIILDGEVVIQYRIGSTATSCVCFKPPKLHYIVLDPNRLPAGRCRCRLVRSNPRHHKHSMAQKCRTIHRMLLTWSHTLQTVRRSIPRRGMILEDLIPHIQSFDQESLQVTIQLKLKLNTPIVWLVVWDAHSWSIATDNSVNDISTAK